MITINCYFTIFTIKCLLVSIVRNINIIPTSEPETRDDFLQCKSLIIRYIKRKTLVLITFHQSDWTVLNSTQQHSWFIWDTFILLIFKDSTHTKKTPVNLVRDNQRLADCMKNRPTRFKSFNARLAVDYPAYAMVFCQVIDKLKLVLLFAAQYLTEWVKMTVIFVSYGSLAPSTPECTLDDGAGRHIWAGRHVSLRPPPISLVYNTAELIGVDVCAWAFFYIRFYEWSTLFGCTTEILSANNSDFS